MEDDCCAMTLEFAEIFRMWAAERGLTTESINSLFGHTFGYNIFLFNEHIGSLYGVNNHLYEFLFAKDACRAFNGEEHYTSLVPGFRGSVFDPDPLKQICDAIDKIIDIVGDKKAIAEEIRDYLQSEGYKIEIKSLNLFAQNVLIDVHVTWRSCYLGCMEYNIPAGSKCFISSDHYTQHCNNRFKYPIYESPKNTVMITDHLTDQNKLDLKNLFCSRAWMGLKRLDIDESMYCPNCGTHLNLVDGELLLDGSELLNDDDD